MRTASGATATEPSTSAATGSDNDDQQRTAALLGGPRSGSRHRTASSSRTNWTRTTYAGLELTGVNQRRATCPTHGEPTQSQTSSSTPRTTCRRARTMPSRPGVQGQFQRQHHRQPEMARERLRHRQGRRSPGELFTHCSAALPIQRCRTRPQRIEPLRSGTNPPN